MRIGSREIGPNAPVFILAEAGSNHGGSLDAALDLIDAAAEAGADGCKFQRFRVDSFLVPRPNPEALRRYELPDEWLPKLREHCDERGIEFLCTAFDFASLDVVDPFVSAHKVGSHETPMPDFLAAVIAKRKPVLASNGRMPGQWTLDVITLQCVSAYPANIKGYLRSRPVLDPWGVSDHTLDPTTVPAAAVALGACVVEKHMKLVFGKWSEIMQPLQPKNPDGTRPWAPHPPDDVVSIDSDDFAAMVRAIRATESAVRG